MRRFARLFTRLDQTTRVNAKVEALADYFTEAPEADRLWTIALLSHRRPKRTVTTTRLREWAAERAGIPLWLFEESYPIVGDLAETIALILPDLPARATVRSRTGLARSARSGALERGDAQGAGARPPGTASTGRSGSFSTSSSLAASAWASARN